MRLTGISVCEKTSMNGGQFTVLFSASYASLLASYVLLGGPYDVVKFYALFIQFCFMVYVEKIPKREYFVTFFGVYFTLV